MVAERELMERLAAVEARVSQAVADMSGMRSAMQAECTTLVQQIKGEFGE